MANHHLRNRELSLKAKGLLSLMLSLPEDWDYTTQGLSCICKDGVDSICATIKELEKAGYVKRRGLRDAQGRLSDLEYTILEKPEPLPSPPEKNTEKIEKLQSRNTELKKQIQELENIDIIYMVRECGLTPEALSGLLAKVQAAPNAAETKEKEDASIET